MSKERGNFNNAARDAAKLACGGVREGKCIVKDDPALMEVMLVLMNRQPAEANVAAWKQFILIDSPCFAKKSAEREVDALTVTDVAWLTTILV